MQSLFDELLELKLSEVDVIASLRGNQYGDTLRNGQWLIYLAVEKELGDMPPCTEKARALSIAGLCDIKYQRFEGGWRLDNIDDGINYLAILPALVQLAKEAR